MDKTQELENELKAKTNKSQKGVVEQQKSQTHHKPRILIVEDDITFEPFWESVAKRANKNAEIHWASSVFEAENIINDSLMKMKPFDLIITDIFLSGSKTGIDLWKKFSKQMHGRVIVISGIEYQKFIEYFEKTQDRPLYLQKPLIPHECIGAIYNSLNEITG